MDDYEKFLRELLPYLVYEHMDIGENLVAGFKSREQAERYIQNTPTRTSYGHFWIDYKEVEQ